MGWIAVIFPRSWHRSSNHSSSAGFMFRFIAMSSDHFLLSALAPLFTSAFIFYRSLFIPLIRSEFNLPSRLWSFSCALWAFLVYMSLICTHYPMVLSSEDNCWKRILSSRWKRLHIWEFFIFGILQIFTLNPPLFHVSARSQPKLSTTMVLIAIGIGSMLWTKECL